MELEQTINDGYIHLETNISKDEWYAYLTNGISSNSLETLLKFYYRTNHEASCKELSEAFDVEPTSFITPITKIGRDFQHKVKSFKLPESDGNTKFWAVPMDGKEQGNGLFLWKIKSELTEAIQEYLY